MATSGQYGGRRRPGGRDSDPTPDCRDHVPRRRPDLVGVALPQGQAPTLLIVGGDDHGVIELNEEALTHLTCDKHLAIVPGAGHLFEEPGTLDQVLVLAHDWFVPRLHQGG